MNKFIVLKTLIHTIVLFSTRKGIDPSPIMLGKGDIFHQLRVCSMIVLFRTKTNIIWKLLANIREETNRNIVFREIINTSETRPISLTWVFCSGVYYTRYNTYKDCFIRQGTFSISCVSHSHSRICRWELMDLLKRKQWHIT
jgi:hypothetical protein